MSLSASVVDVVAVVGGERDVHSAHQSLFGVWQFVKID